jgi:hypothetical protein
MSKSVKIPPGIASYAHLLEPRADKKGKLKYEVSILISKARALELEPLKQAMLEVATAKWGPKAPTILANAKYPLIKDGDKMLDEETGKPKAGYAGMFVISTRTDRKPQIIGPAKEEVVTDDDVSGIYSGCMIRVSGGMFAYENEGNKGVSIGLNNVQVLVRGKRLDGRKAAVDEFEEWTDTAVTADPLT